MTVAAIIVALLRAFPALQNIFAQIGAELARQNESEALNRKAAKDAAVDSAIKLAMIPPEESDEVFNKQINETMAKAKAASK